MTLFRFCVSSLTVVIVFCYNSDDLSDGYRYQRAFPQDVMVDVINNFGLTLLEAHNENNENNIALSPYGATSVLIALAEGIHGYACKEIQDTVHIPLDISVIRVGLRDIHRHLKSYFIPKEGFLAGLTLSNEKVPLLPKYEEILRFYGYDLDSFNNALYPDDFENTAAVYMNITTMTTPFITQTTMQDITTTEIPIGSLESRVEFTEVMSTSTPISVDVMTTITTVGNTVTTATLQDTTTATTESSTILERERNITTIKEALPTMITTTNPSLITPADSKNDTDSSLSNSNIEEITITSTFEPISTIKANIADSTTISYAESTTLNPNNVITNSELPITTFVDPISSTTGTETPIQTTNTIFTRNSERTTPFFEETSEISLPTSTESLPTSNFQNELSEITNSSTTTNSNDDTQSTLETFSFSKLESTQNQTDQTIDDTSSEIIVTTSVTHSISKVTTTYETSSSFELISTNSEEISTLPNDITTVNTEMSDNITEDASIETSTQQDTNRRVRSIVDYFIARYYDDLPRRHNYGRKYEPEEKLSFLVYGKVRETNINFMTYDAVLPISYIPIIDAMALSFPLDSKEYYLLLLLPVEEDGIDKLVHNLKKRISLRNIISSLRYSHVKAIIPSFMLKGYVILTPTLQKLGIRRIFEPRHTDFSLMTKEKDIYVTNIEQAVTVTIRNYVAPENLPNYRDLQRFRPTEFKADHPFLYFVMDTDIHVNLMAGKIVNPLNSRIR